MWWILCVGGTLFVAVTCVNPQVYSQEASNTAYYYKASNDNFVTKGYPQLYSSDPFTYPSPRTKTTPKTLITGYPKVTPNDPFTYPSRTTKTTPKPLITGYPKVTPSNPFTYPSPTTTTTPKPLITGYSRLTTSQTFNYPSPTTRTTPKPFTTGYPRVTPSQPFTYPSPTTTTPKPFTTGYPRVTTSQTFTYTSPTTTPKLFTTGYPRVTTSQTFNYPSPTTRTTPKPLITGYPRVTPSQPFTYPFPTTRTTPKPFTTGYPRVTTTTPKPFTTGYPRVTTSQTFNYPSPTTRTTQKPLITGYPRITPSQPFVYPSPTTRTTRKPFTTGYPRVTTSQTFTYPSPTTSPKPFTTGYPRVTTTTPKPFTTGYPRVTTSQTFNYPSPATRTTPKPLITGYPQVTPSHPFTYPSPTTRTTPKPFTTGYPRVTTSHTLNYPSPTTRTTPKPFTTGYPRVTTRQTFTYPSPTTTTKPFTTGYPRVTTTTPKPFTTAYPLVTTSQTFNYPSPTTRTTPKPLITGYPRVTPSQPFTYTSPTTRTTPKPFTTGYPRVTTSRTFNYPSPTSRTTPKPLITGYPRVTPSQTFTYPSPITRTTPKPYTTGYPRVTTSQTFAYPSPTTTTPKPITTGYPRVTTSQTLNYPSPTTRTTLKPLITGYPRVTPSQTFTYPSPTTRTPKPFTTGYPQVTTSQIFNYPTTTHKTVITGYPKYFPNKPFTYPTTQRPTVTGYPVISPDNPFVYLPPVEQFYLKDDSYLQSSIAKRRVYRSPAEEDGIETEVPQVTTLLVDHIHDDGHYHHDDGHYNPHEDHSHWDIRKSVPGEPGKDYPVFDSIPHTSFSCKDKSEGYYADGETGCQVFHVCSATPGKIKSSFLCPNGSIFNQRLFTCDWWNNVDCAASESYYTLNIFGLMESQKSTSDLELKLILNHSKNVDSTPQQNITKNIVTPGRGVQNLDNVFGFMESHHSTADFEMALALNGSGDISATPVENSYKDVDNSINLSQDKAQQNPNKNVVTDIHNVHNFVDSTKSVVDVVVTPHQIPYKSVITPGSENTYLPPETASTHAIILPSSLLPPLEEYPTTLPIPSEVAYNHEIITPQSVTEKSISPIFNHNNKPTYVTSGDIPSNSHEKLFPSQLHHKSQHVPLPTVKSSTPFEENLSIYEEISNIPSLPAIPSTIYKEESSTQGDQFIPSTIQNGYIPPQQYISKADAPLINPSTINNKYFNSQSEISTTGFPSPNNPSTLQNEYISPEISTPDTSTISSEYLPQQREIVIIGSSVMKPSTINNEYLAPQDTYIPGDLSSFFKNNPTTSDVKIHSQEYILSETASSTPLAINSPQNQYPIYSQTHSTTGNILPKNESELISNEFHLLQTPETVSSSAIPEIHKTSSEENSHEVQFIDDMLNAGEDSNLQLDERFLGDEEPEVLLQTSEEENLPQKGSHNNLDIPTYGSEIQRKEQNGPSLIDERLQGNKSQSKLLDQITGVNEQQQVLPINADDRVKYVDAKPIDAYLPPDVEVGKNPLHKDQFSHQQEIFKQDAIPLLHQSTSVPSSLTSDNSLLYNIAALGKSVSPPPTHAQQSSHSDGGTLTYKNEIQRNSQSTSAHSSNNLVVSKAHTSAIFHSPIQEEYQYNSLPLSEYQLDTSSYNNENNIRTESKNQLPLTPTRTYNFQQFQHEIPFARTDTYNHNIGVQPPIQAPFGAMQKNVQEKQSGPELIQSVSFNFDTLDGQREFARAVAAGLLGDQPAQPHLEDFSQQNGYLNYIPPNPLSYNSPTRQQNYY